MPNWNSGGSSGNSEWETNSQIYVSPNGSNSNDGKGWNTAKKNIYNGLGTLLDSAGGTLFVAEGCTVGGPVEGQGIRIRSDALTGFFNAPGFLNVTSTSPVKIVGCGKNNGSNSFITGVQARFTGGGLYRDPAIWAVGSLSMPTLMFENLRIQQPRQIGTQCGIDYDRKLDGTEQAITVQNATRVGTTTVFTVDLPASIVALASATREDNVTTLTMPNPGLPFPPWRGGTKIRVVTSDVNYPSGDYEITDCSNPLEGNTTWTVSYSDPGADMGPTVITGTIQTHGMRAGDIFMFSSTVPEFTITTYFVSASTIDTITVDTDITNVSGDCDVDDPGTIYRQERFYCGTSNTQFYNVSMSVATFGFGYASHGFDFGHTQAIMPTLDHCWFDGFAMGVPERRDERICTPVYVYPGCTPTAGPGVAAIRCRDSAGTNGPIYVEKDPNGIGNVDVRRVIIETGDLLVLGLPALRIDGNGYFSVLAEDIGNADAGGEFPTVVLNDCPPTSEVKRSGYVQGPCIGGDMWQVPSSWYSPGRNEPTPWQYSHVTAWADGRITGKHPAAVRAMGPVAARFKNVVSAPGDWEIGAAQTITEGQPAPDGSDTAVLIETTVQGICNFKANSVDAGVIFDVGTKLVIAGWINASVAGALIPSALFSIETSGVTFEEGYNISCPYTGTGWQFVSTVRTVATVSDSTPAYRVGIVCQPADITIWGMTVFAVPATGNDNNDIYEMIGTLKHQPLYLEPGMSGTMEDQKFIAHGGIGGPAPTATLGSANGKAVPYYNSAGVLQGYLELKDLA